MIVFLVVSVILLAGAAVAATLGRLGRTGLQLHPPASSIGGVSPASGTPVRSNDIDDIRFDVAVRGYRMDQVDTVLGQLRRTIAHLESQADRARGGSGEPGANPDGGLTTDGVANSQHMSGADGHRMASGASVHAFSRRERPDEKE